MSKEATSNKLYEIFTKAMILSQSDVERVTVEYDGKTNNLHVVIGDAWSVYVPMGHAEFQFQLNVILDRLDRLMDQVEIGRVA